MKTTTMSKVTDNDFLDENVVRSKTKSWSSPVVSAMLSGNRMDNCHDVKEFYLECQASPQEMHICATATKYFESCLSLGGSFDDSHHLMVSSSSGNHNGSNPTATTSEEFALRVP